jgi:nucleoside-diphosphate-sugar epimerase
MKILLTGSSGTIGTRLFEKLVHLDYDVIGVDRKSNEWNTSLNKKTIKIDLLKQNSLTKLPTNVDLVIHLAANARVYDLIKNPNLALENMITAFNVIDFAKKINSNFIFSSSREVYGNSFDENTITEEKAKIEFSESPYSASKICAEALIHSYKNTFDLNFIIIRFSNVYGIYDVSDRVIPLWIKRALKNENIIIYGADKILDFTYIDDAVNGVIKAIERFDKIKAQTFNIASNGRGKALTYVAHKIIELLESESKITIKENRQGEVYKFQADISKAIKLLDYKPNVDLDEGLIKTIRWYKQFEKRCEN